MSATSERPGYNDLIKLSRTERLAWFEELFLVPIDHSIIPVPGPDFARWACDLTETKKLPPKMERESLVERALDTKYRDLLYKRGLKFNIEFKGDFSLPKFLPGGFWVLPEAFNHKNSSVDMLDHDWFNYRRVSGPRLNADVMLVGKHPGKEELEWEQNFIGPSSEPLHRALREIGVVQAERDGWYVTNTVKFNRLDPQSGNMQQAWLKDCAPLLLQEILLVRPKFLLCLGTEAIKGVMGKHYAVGNVAGRVIEMPYSAPPEEAATHAEFDDLSSYVEHKVLVMGIPHPAYVFRQPEAYDDLHNGLKKFVDLARSGVQPPDVESNKIHRSFHIERPLAGMVDEILDQAREEWDFEADGDVPIAWDAEWHGRYPGDAGSYLRTIQFAATRNFEDNADKRAHTVVLTEQGGGPGWLHCHGEVTRAIRRLLEGRHSHPKAPRIRTRHGGHFFKADIPWISKFLGVDFKPYWSSLPPNQPVKRFDGHKFRKAYAKWVADKKKAAVEAVEAIALNKEPKKFTDPEPTRDDIELDDNGKPVRDKNGKPVLAYRDRILTPFQMTRYTGGFDTGYMTHSVFEAMESFSLEHVAMRFTTCPRWDIEMEQAKVQVAKEMGIKVRELMGYGDIPDTVLLPYACYDADATLRLFWRLNFQRGQYEGEGFLDHDVNHQNSREAFWMTMLAGLTFLEMEEVGVTVDIGRGKELIKAFEFAKERLTQSLRDTLKWDTFNPNSSQQVRAWLFGEEYSGAIDKKTGQRKQLMPREKMTLGQTPIKTTGKPSRAWAKILSLPADQRKIYLPAVDKEVLGIIAWDIPLVKQLRDIRYIRQVLQSVLRPPKPGDALGADDDGVVYDEADEFDGGFLSYVNHSDSRIRSRFYPVETGRCSSAAPNMQNLAKRREDDYARILGHTTEDGQVVGDYTDILGEPLYHDPIRSIVTAGFWDGEPTVLMEFDIVSAEIAGLAWESGDKQMIEDVKRAMLPESDPNFLDIHSSTAVEAFKLTCAPTKKGLKSIGKPGLRVAAKNVRFGVPYGRSAEALSRQCQEEGADVEVAECQRLISSYHKRYPAASIFLAACEARPASEYPYLYGAFGRIRRFQRVDDQGMQAEQGRSAKNYPIQNLVADYIMMVMYYLRVEREKRGLEKAFRFVLQIHDALMFEVKIPYIEKVEQLVTDVMRNWVPVMPRTLNNTPFDKIGTDDEEENDSNPKAMQKPDISDLALKKAYHFEVDSSVFLNWSQPIDPKRGRSLGIPEKYLDDKR
jgi:uracil-DNA glycosylase family 4